jgi:hypothetical protein
MLHKNLPKNVEIFSDIYYYVIAKGPVLNVLIFAPTSHVLAPAILLLSIVGN